METHHRWYPLLREWRRALKADNKSPRTIGNYDESARLFAAWLDEPLTTPLLHKRDGNQ